MAWDDELQRLTDYVQDNLGEMELDAAIVSAYYRLVRSEKEFQVDGDDGPLAVRATDGMRVIADDGRQWSLDELYETLRIELRSVVRPNRGVFFTRPSRGGSLRVVIPA